MVDFYFFRRLTAFVLAVTLTADPIMAHALTEGLTVVSSTVLSVSVDQPTFTAQALSAAAIFENQTPAKVERHDVSGWYRLRYAFPGVAVATVGGGFWKLWQLLGHLASQTVAIVPTPVKAIHALTHTIETVTKFKLGNGASPWSVARHVLGNGSAYQRIVDLNSGARWQVGDWVKVPGKSFQVAEPGGTPISLTVYQHPFLHEIFNYLHQPLTWVYLGVGMLLAGALLYGWVKFIRTDRAAAAQPVAANFFRRLMNGFGASLERIATVRGATALFGLVATLIPALAQQRVPPAGVVPQHTIEELLEKGTARVNQDADIKGRVSKTASDFKDAQDRANTVRLGVWGDLERGPDLERLGPYLIWNKPGHDPAANQKDRQKKTSQQQSDQQTALVRQTLADQMLDAFIQYRTAHNKIDGLNQRLALARELAPKPEDTEDSLIKANSDFTLQLQSELTEAEREAQQALGKIRDILGLPPTKLPPGVYFEIPNSKIDYARLDKLLSPPQGTAESDGSDGKSDRDRSDGTAGVERKKISPDPQALGEAMGIALAVDHAQAAFEVNLRSVLEKMNPTNWQINFIPFIHQPAMTSFLGFVIPSFQTSDPFDAEGELALLKEAQNSFLTFRYQRFQDLNSVLQSIPKHRASARAFEAQADAALRMAQDSSRPVEERRRFNKESQDASQQAEDERGKAAQLERSARSVRVPESLLDALDTMPNWKIEEQAKGHVWAIYKVAAEYSASMAEAFQKALGSYKLNSKRSRQAVRFKDPAARLRALGSQSIEPSDGAANIDNDISAANRNALSHPKITTAPGINAGKIYRAPTSNQVDAPTMMDRSAAINGTENVTVPLRASATRRAQDAVNSAAIRLAELAKQGRLDDDAIQAEIAAQDVALLWQMLDALSDAQQQVHFLMNTETDPQERAEYDYLEKQILARMAAVEVLQAEADGNAASALKGSSEDSPNAAPPVTVAQAVENYHAALANQTLANNPAKKGTLDLWPMGNSRNTFNVISEGSNLLVMPVVNGAIRTGKAVGHAAQWMVGRLRGEKKKAPNAPADKRSDDQIKADQGVEAAKIQARSWMARVKANDEAGRTGLGLYADQIKLLQKSLEAAVAHEQQVRNQQAPLKEILAASAQRKQAESDLLNAQREQATFAKLAARAQKEHEELQDVLVKKDDKSLSPEEKQFRRDSASLTDEADPLLEQELLAELQEKTAKLLKTPGTAGITAWGSPYFLFIDQPDTQSSVTRTLGFHASASIDPLARANAQATGQDALDQAVQAAADAKDNAEQSTIRRTTRLATLSDIASSNERIAKEAESSMPAGAPLVDELQKRHRDAQILLVKSGGRLGKSGTLGTERPRSITADNPQQIATAIAYKLVPEPAADASAGKKKLETPAATVVGGTHNRTQFAGITANASWPIWHRGALNTARRAADTAATDSKARDRANQRTEIINTISSRFRLVDKLTTEWQAAEKEALRARATLDSYQSLLQKGGCTSDDVAEPFQKVQEADARLLLARGKLEETKRLLERDLSNLAPDDVAKLPDPQREALRVIRPPIPPSPPIVVTWNDTELAVRLLAGKIVGATSDSKILARLLKFVQVNAIPVDQIPHLADLVDKVQLADPAPQNTRAAKLDVFMKNLEWAVRIRQDREGRAGRPIPSYAEALNQVLQDPEQMNYVRMVADRIRTFGERFAKAGWVDSEDAWRTFAWEQAGQKNLANTLVPLVKLFMAPVSQDVLSALINFPGGSRLTSLLHVADRYQTWLQDHPQVQEKSTTSATPLTGTAVMIQLAYATVHPMSVSEKERWDLLDEAFDLNNELFLESAEFGRIVWSQRVERAGAVVSDLGGRHSPGYRIKHLGPTEAAALSPESRKAEFRRMATAVAQKTRASFRRSAGPLSTTAHTPVAIGLFILKGLLMSSGIHVPLLMNWAFLAVMAVTTYFFFFGHAKADSKRAQPQRGELQAA